MKKVRYAIGAIGAVPALGLVMTPAAHAAPAPAQAAHPARDVAKRVSLTHTGAAGVVTPAITCQTTTITTATANGLHGRAAHNGTCLAVQSAWITHAQTGLTERVRVYNTHNSLVYTGWLHGRIYTSSNNSLTAFGSSPNIPNVGKVCEALVANSNHNVVKYGQVCETV